MCAGVEAECEVLAGVVQDEGLPETAQMALTCDLQVGSLSNQICRALRAAAACLLVVQIVKWSSESLRVSKFAVRLWIDLPLAVERTLTFAGPRPGLRLRPCADALKRWPPSG